MTYFEKVFLKEYREKDGVKSYCFPLDIRQQVDISEIKRLRNVLRNAYLQNRTEKTHTKLLSDLLRDYKGIVVSGKVSCSKRRYNAFIYKYMIDVFVGNKVIAAKLKVSTDTLNNDLKYVFDDLMIMCIGLPAAGGSLNSQRKCIQFMMKNKDLLLYPTGDYVNEIWRQHGKEIRELHKKSLEITEQMTRAIVAYTEYCRDEDNPSEVDRRKADVLEDYMNGMNYGAIAEKYGCCIDTIYDDMRDVETKLAQMLFI